MSYAIANTYSRESAILIMKPISVWFLAQSAVNLIANICSIVTALILLDSSALHKLYPFLNP